MRMRTALVSTLIANFIFGDEICENTDGDLFFISNPDVMVNVTNPRSSPFGSLEQHLNVDDHEYTVQIREPPSAWKGGELYYKEGFKSEDMIEINQTLLQDLVRRYGFKDFYLTRNFGFQERSKGSPAGPEVSCYYYQCDASVANVDCNLKPNTPTCKLSFGLTRTPTNFKPVDETKLRFFGQCIMHLTPVTGNLFDIWLQSALTEGLPDVTVLENYVILDWGEAASMFPEGQITYDLSLSNDEKTLSKTISTQTLGPQIIFTNLDLSSVGSSLLDVTQDLGWKVSFNMTVELDQTIPTEDKRKCETYNRDQQTMEDKCTADENCRYSTIMEDCTWRSTKKVNKTYKIPMFPGQRIPVKSHETSNC